MYLLGVFYWQVFRHTFYFHSTHIHVPRTMTMQDIRDERVKELSLEHTRYFDLLRWNIVKERILDTPDIKSESGGVGSYQPGREYLNIPQRDLDLLPNLKPNPGY